MNASKKSDSTHAYQWECGWDEHEQKQLERLANLPFSEKLEWLEEAHRLVIQLEIAKSSCKDTPPSSKH
jgi:hypothetical protein